MLLIIRKTHLLIAAAVIGIAILSVCIGNYAAPETAPAADPNLLIIDPGHGGLDGGATGASGVLEKDINLKVSLYLKELAEQDGKTVIMTRDTDTSLHTTDSSVVRAQKRSDLENRKKILQENSQGTFISIHMNKFEQSKYRGAQVFYADNDASRTLAERIQQALIDGLQDGNTRVAKPAPESLYIFKGCTSNAVVVECGFLSNPEEEKLLAEDEYQKKLAQCIYSGIKPAS